MRVDFFIFFASFDSACPAQERKNPPGTAVFLSAVTLSIVTLSIVTLSNVTLSEVEGDAEREVEGDAEGDAKGETKVRRNLSGPTAEENRRTKDIGFDYAQPDSHA